MDGYIYIIKNDIDKHVYIGQTINTLNDRLKEHFSKSKRINSKFYKAVSPVMEQLEVLGYHNSAFG